MTSDSDSEAKAREQKAESKNWIPAFAGMTSVKGQELGRLLAGSTSLKVARKAIT